MHAIDRKLLRDMLRMRGQVVTIALVVACGIASYVAIEGTHASLLRARDAYYERMRFPDLFAHLERAPDATLAWLERVSGVAYAQTRLVASVSMPLPALQEGATGLVVSLPKQPPGRLASVSLSAGRMPAPGRSDEVVVLEAFARAHDLAPGQRLPIVIGGIRSDPVIVGVGLTPEYVFSIAPGEMMPDPRRFGVVWMDRDAVAAALDMRGAFNDVVARLQPGASERAVRTEIDRVLLPYGGIGAYGRERQVSNNALRGELAQLEMLVTMMPTIFLGVAAFLINVVLSRLVQLQRPQIATLKAIGYRDGRVGLHYLKLVSAIVLGGALLGIGVGWFTGQVLTELYTEYFRFPALAYQLQLRGVTAAVLISMLAAVAGALGSVRAVMRLPPAEAMRPEQPAKYRSGIASRLGRLLWIGNAATMVVRELERRPLRALLSALGVAMGIALLISGRFGIDAVEWFIAVQFELEQREDVSVAFRQPVDAAALHELAHLPGVISVEGLRAAPVRYRSEHRTRDSVLFGHPEHPSLRRVLDKAGRVHELPGQGIVLSATLGRVLDVRAGDWVELEVLEGDRRHARVPVAALVDDVLGLFGHMQAQALDRLLGTQSQVSQALLRIDPLQYPALARALKQRPNVLSLTRRDAIIDAFRKQTAGQMRVTTLILSVFAAIIASGVVYNNARIALSTRSRDLCSLRVLGFRRREVSAILLGELAVHVLLALPPGMYLGRVLCELMMAGADPEMFRFPPIVSAHTYAFAVTVTLAASLASALLVRRRLDHLDLIGALKSRE